MNGGGLTHGLTVNVLQRATWKEYGLEKVVADIRNRYPLTNADDIMFGLAEEEKVRLSERVAIALHRLELGVINDWLGNSSDLAAKLGGLLVDTPIRTPDKGESVAQVVAKRVSEALSELEHAADVVLRHGPDDMAISKVFIGVRGPRGKHGALGGGGLPPGADAGYGPYKDEGALPMIAKAQLEADTYYRSRDGYVHVVEVKDSVNALRSKLTEQRQYTRQIRWLKAAKGADDRRVIEYFIQDPRPFHRLLDPSVITPFGEIESAQASPGQSWIKLGDERFTFADFKRLYDDAMKVFNPYLKKYKLKGASLGAFLDQYFGTKELARESIKNPACMDGFKK